MKHSHRVQTNLGTINAGCIDDQCTLTDVISKDGYDFPWDFRLTKDGTVVELTYEGEHVFELRSKSMPDTESAAIVVNALNRDSQAQEAEPPVSPTDLLTNLMSQSYKAAKWRAHDLGGFTATPDWANRLKVWVASCKKCAMQAAVTPNPQPNECQIAGEALALGCTG